MSQENQSKPRNGGGQRRQGGNSNPNRNRNRNRSRNRNGNRNRNRQGGQGGQGGGGRRKRQPKPVPLTFWEKVLKFFGLYKAPTRPPRRRPATGDAALPDGKKPVKSNTRNARGKGSEAQGAIKAKGRGAGEKGKDFPVETPRLYLGNLSYDATEKDLEELFKGIGTVSSVEIIYNRHTHRSKGYGFLEMLSVEEAKRAVEELHDKEFMGRHLIVNGAKAKPDPDQKPRERKPREPRQRDQKPTRGQGGAARLTLANISPDADESALEELFKGIGNVRRVELLYNPQTHRHAGSGHIDMQKAEDARRAVEVLHDQPFMGHKLVVSAEKTEAEQPEAPAETQEAPAEA